MVERRRQDTERIVSDASRANVALSLESLQEFYAAHDASKSAEDLAKIFDKCTTLSGAGGACARDAGAALVLSLEVASLAQRGGEKETLGFSHRYTTAFCVYRRVARRASSVRSSRPNSERRPRSRRASATQQSEKSGVSFFETF